MSTRNWRISIETAGGLHWYWTGKFFSLNEDAARYYTEQGSKRLFTILSGQWLGQQYAGHKIETISRCLIPGAKS